MCTRTIMAKTGRMWLMALIVGTTAWLIAPTSVDGQTCRRQCKDGETRNARGCCVADKSGKRKNSDRSSERKKVGRIFVDANVSGAEVFVDGERQPRSTPVTVRGVPPGKHLVEVKHNNRTESREVEVKAGKRATFTARFPATAGKKPTSPEQEAAELNEKGKKAWMKDENVELAVEYFRQAVRLHPAPKYQFNMCYAEFQLGHLVKARPVCERVVAATKKDDSLNKKALMVVQEIDRQLAQKKK